VRTASCTRGEAVDVNFAIRSEGARRDTTFRYGFGLLLLVLRDRDVEVASMASSVLVDVVDDWVSSFKGPNVPFFPCCGLPPLSSLLLLLLLLVSSSSSSVVSVFMAP